MRSWYGIVEQVAGGFAKNRLMEPFRIRALLKKAMEFAWSLELQGAFKVTEAEIVWVVENGVCCFRFGQWQALVMDWSKTGIRFVLWQKRCSCNKIHPSCCPGGWVVIRVGSRVCSGAGSK